MVIGQSCPIGRSAIAGLCSPYGGGPYPAEYDGALFFADYTRRCIWAMGRGRLQSRARRTSGAQWEAPRAPSSCRSVPTAISTTSTSAAARSAASSTALAPISHWSVAAANPTSGDYRHDGQLRRLGSSDPNGDPLSYEWDLDGDGSFDDSTAVRPSWTYNTAGNFRVSLRVSDGRGGTADAVTIGVGRPNVTISAPATAFRWKVGDTVSFSGSATDNQGAAIPASNLTWRLVLKHGACPDCHEHFLQTFSGTAGGNFVAPDHDFPSELELSLTATDSSGLANTASVRVLPSTTTLTFATNPSGLTLTFNGANATAPFARAR